MSIFYSSTDAATTIYSIIVSPSKFKLVVGSMQFLPNMYANICNQLHDKCAESRYLKCNENMNTCQYPLKIFWNGN
ncbi:hypothetical protein I4U23_004401 [Adineta vaga]|nr:hypothetical protein I4U23_004401 [Adineta vaga]